MSTQSIPRIVIAGLSSGVGKTTVMVALSRALKLRGLNVAVFKTGPDYLDPTYHARAANTASHTLDGWMMGRQAVLETFARVSRNADIALVEGVMGIFDGASPTSEEGSTAQIAKWLRAPALLVIDVSGMARTIAAVVHGCTIFDPELKLAGVVCNRLGSRRHLELLRAALPSPPIVGGLPKEPSLKFPERHLGLRTASDAGITDALLDQWAECAEQWLDIDNLLAIARSAEDIPDDVLLRATDAPQSICRIAYAFDEAFHFYYEDNLQRLRALGAELIPFSPIHDRNLPPADGLYLGGGYPELYAEALSNNFSMKHDIATFAASGAPVYAECGGMMYLASSIRTLDGSTYPMLDLIAAEIVMRDRLQALGYVEVQTTSPSIFGPAGIRFRGHQFRYSEITRLSSEVKCIYSLNQRRTGTTQIEGFSKGNILGSYIHAHWASNPAITKELVAKCIEYAQQIR